MFKIKRMIQEEWRTCKNYPYYEVSNLGRVRSIDRTIILKSGKFYHRKGKELTPIWNERNGRYQIMFTVHCKVKLQYLHRLVAEAFVENPHNLRNVIFLDNDPKNCRYDNLLWVSGSWRKNKELNLI